MTFTVPPNAAISPNRGSFNVSAGQNFIGQALIVQEGVACAAPHGLAQVTIEMPFDGGSATVTVTAPSSCGWSVQGVMPWIALTSPGFQSGNGAITFQVGASPTIGTRTAVLGVNGRSFIVSQPSGCAVITQLPATLSQAGGTYVLPVSAAPSCQWTTSTNSDWADLARVTEGIQLTVARNDGMDDRSFNFTLNGRSYSLTQPGRSQNPDELPRRRGHRGVLLDALCTAQPDDPTADGRYALPAIGWDGLIPLGPCTGAAVV